MTFPPGEGGYDGPIVEATIRVAGRPIVLVQPEEPDRLLDLPEVRARNAADDYMPYWAYLWPGSLLLGGAIASAGIPPGARCLEIGCGLGLSGLFAVASGLNVRFTDYDRAPLGFVEASARANGFGPASYSTALLDWRTPPLERYPWIFGADVTYERRLVPLVAGLIAAMLEPGGLALITDPGRPAASDLPRSLTSLGLASEALPVEADSDRWGRVRGTTHRVWHPGR